MQAPAQKFLFHSEKRPRGRHKYRRKNTNTRIKMFPFPFAYACVFAVTSENEIPLRHNTTARIFTTRGQEPMLLTWLYFASDNTGSRFPRALTVRNVRMILFVLVLASKFVFTWVIPYACACACVALWKPGLTQSAVATKMATASLRYRSVYESYERLVNLITKTIRFCALDFYVTKKKLGDHPLIYTIKLQLLLARQLVLNFLIVFLLSMAFSARILAGWPLILWLSLLFVERWSCSPKLKPGFGTISSLCFQYI